MVCILFYNSTYCTVYCPTSAKLFLNNIFVHIIMVYTIHISTIIMWILSYAFSTLTYCLWQAAVQWSKDKAFETQIFIFHWTFSAYNHIRMGPHWQPHHRSPLGWPRHPDTAGYRHGDPPDLSSRAAELQLHGPQQREEWCRSHSRIPSCSSCSVYNIVHLIHFCTRKKEWASVFQWQLQMIFCSEHDRCGYGYHWFIFIFTLLQCPLLLPTLLMALMAAM